MDDRALAELAVERGLVTRRQIDACLRELEAPNPDGERRAPSLAVLLLAKGLLNEAALYELSQLHRARTMDPSDSATATPRVQRYPLPDERPAPPPARPKRKGPPAGPPPKKPPTPEEIELAGQQTFVDNRTQRDAGLPPEAAEAALLEDYCFKQYVLTQELGKGGMGVVWKAWQRDLKRWVAIKFLESDDREILRRFITEAQSVASLSHPNITALYELGEFEENYYIVMEYVEGSTLEALLGKLAIDPAVRAFHACALALDHAHRHNIIHRDIKPQNIMFTRPGKPYLMDFGLAKQKKSDSSGTVAGMILGTPAYMAPEQAEGKFQRIDRRSDVYSLAATFYAVLAGKPPFAGRAVMDTLYKVVHTEAAPLRKHNPRVPPEIEAIIQKAMSKLPAERYATARELAADLQRFLNGEPILALPASGVQKMKHAVRKNRGLVILAIALAVVAAGVTAAYFAVRSSREEPSPTAAATPTPSTAPPARDPLEQPRAALAALEEVFRDPDATPRLLNSRAERCLSAVAEAGPPNPELHAIRGIALARLDRRAEAEEALAQAGPRARMELAYLHLPYDSAKARLHLEAVAAADDPRAAKLASGFLALIDGRAVDAAAAAEELLRRQARAEHFWLRGLARSASKDPAGALADYEAALRIEPNRPRILLDAANLSMQLGRVDQALALAERLVDFSPANELALVARGAAYDRKRDRDRARRDMEAALRVNPQHFTAHRNMVVLSRSVDELRDNAARALECPSGKAQELLDVATFLAENGQHELALKFLDRAEKAGADANDVSGRRVAAFLNLKQWEPAEAEVRRIGQRTGRQAEMNSQLCMLCAVRGDHEKGLEYGNRAVELDSNLAFAYANRGACFSGLKRWKEAVDDYRKAIGLNPELEKVIGKDLRAAEENLRRP